MQAIRVLINGASGKMGQETIKAINQAEGLELVGAVSHPACLESEILTAQADVVVDFTAPDCVYENALSILNAHARPVIGTTGLTAQEISELQLIAETQQLGGLIAPNFSIGAILVMQFSAQAARYYDYVEIIEKHHEQKKDAPSGTALKAAEKIAEQRRHIPTDQTEREVVAHSRGALYHDIPIHAVRMPGIVANLQTIFGGCGETLTLSHETIHRECFMPGVVLACREVMKRDQLYYGLEHFI